jgi:predicted aldo/keto reductase-like oxidoreductase
MDRRDFLKHAAAAAAVAGLENSSGQDVAAAQELQGGTAHSSLPLASVVNGIGRRKLGHSDVDVSIIGVGGYHLGLANVQEQDAIRIIRHALDEGINFLDNCWDYNAGVSEERMGKALQGRLPSKGLPDDQDRRSHRSGSSQADRRIAAPSQYGHRRPLQIHEVIRMGDAEQAFQPGNVIDVLQQARKEGKIRFIGFTGHKSPEMHLNMIAAADRHHFKFDTVQMPVNALDDHFDSFGRLVIPVARQHNIAILGMKSLSNGAILKTNTVTAVEALHYAMSVPVTLTVCGCESMANLDEKISVARNFKPMSTEQKIAVLRKTAPFGGDGKYEDYKNSHRYDGTFHNPQWLG